MPQWTFSLLICMSTRDTAGFQNVLHWHSIQPLLLGLELQMLEINMQIKAKGASLSPLPLILFRNISEGVSTACPPCSIRPPCCKMLVKPFSLKSALGTMGTSLTRPVSLWHQPLNTAVQYLMVRLALTIPCRTHLQWVRHTTSSMQRFLPLVAVIPGIRLV